MLRFAVGQTHAGEGLSRRSFLDSIRRLLGLVALTEHWSLTLATVWVNARLCSRAKQFAYQGPAYIDCRATCIIKDVRCSCIQGPDASRFLIKKKAVLPPAYQPPLVYGSDPRY